MKRNGRVILRVLCFGAAAISACLTADAAPGRNAIIGGEELAAFNVTLYGEKELFPLDVLATLEGGLYDPEAVRGKYVLVNLWATWCPYCRREKPSLQRLYQEQAGGPFTVLAVSVGEDAGTVKGFMDENGYDFPLALDPQDELKEEYALRIPVSYLIGPEGDIIARINGSKEWDSEQARRVLNYLVPAEGVFEARSGA